MRRRAGWMIVSALGFAALGLRPGCSVINSYDAIVPHDAGGIAGLIVVGGFIVGDGAGADQYFLTALDPADGTEFTSAHRSMTVAGIQYDRANDLWYVFESATMGQIFPLWSEKFYVHAMRFGAGGTWTELGAASIPPAVSSLTTAILNDGLAYVAYSDPQDPTKLGLVTLDTTHLLDTGAIVASAPLPIVDQSSGLAVNPKNLVALTGAPFQGANEGGNLILWFRPNPTPAAPVDAGTMMAPADLPEASPDEEASTGSDDAGDEAGSIGEDATVPIVDASTHAAADAAGDATTARPPAPPVLLQAQEYLISFGGNPSVPPPRFQFAGPAAGPLVGLATIVPAGAQLPLALVVTHPVTAPQASLSLYDMSADYAGTDPASPQGPWSFTFGSDYTHQEFNIQPPAFSSCDNTVFVIGTNVARNVFAIPLGGAQAGAFTGAMAPVPTNGNTEHSGQGLYFEPYTKTVLAPYAQANTKYLTAFHFDPTDGGALAARTNWNPPQDFRVNFLAIRNNFTCP